MGSSHVAVNEQLFVHSIFLEEVFYNFQYFFKVLSHWEVALAVVMIGGKSVTWYLNGVGLDTSLFIVDLAILKMFCYFFLEEKVLVTEEESLANLALGAIQTSTMTFSVLYI